MSLILISLFILLDVINYRLYKNKFNKALIFSLLWSFFICFGIILFHNIYTFDLYGLYWIFLMCCFFSLAYYFFNRWYTHIIIKKGEETENCNTKIVSYILIATVIVKIISITIYLIVNGITLSDLFPGNITDTIQKLTLMKYGERPLSNPFYLSIMNGVSYAGVIVFGYYYLRSSKKTKLLGLLFVLVYMISSVLTVSKLEIILLFVLFASGLICSISNSNMDFKNILLKNKKMVFALGIVILLITCFIIIHFLIRSNFTRNPFTSFALYGFGQVPAFDFYFDNLRTSNLSYGLYTFYGVLDNIGLIKESIPQGLYEKVVLTNELTTNIFTIFRPLIDDFGLFGSSVYVLALGSIAAYVDSTKRSGYIGIAFISFSCFMNSMIMLSFITSIFYYFVICFAYFIFGIILIIIRKVERRKISYGKNTNTNASV